MKTNKLLFGKGFAPGMFSLVLMAISCAVFFQTCQLQKDELLQNVSQIKLGSKTDVLQLKSGSVTNNQSVIFYGHEKFTRDSGKPVAVKKRIGSEKLLKFEPNFVVHIVNGNGKTNLVSSAIVKIDGKIIFNVCDFSQLAASLSKDFSGLTENSELEVELRSTPESYIDFWIEGSLKGVTDVDDNFYDIVTIGTQIWMAENLQTTKYNDGTSIPLVTNSIEWPSLAAPGYCWYNNAEATYKNSYGALYNWFTVNTGKLCPLGWHVPSDAEWTTLINHLDGTSVAGGKLKEIGISHWLSPNIGATNSNGFTALPGGNRFSNGAFANLGSMGFWWSSTTVNIFMAWSRYLCSSNTNVNAFDQNKHDGFSVRCLRDDNSTSSLIPTLYTMAASSITLVSASSGGNVTSVGGSPLSACGVCWSISKNPTISYSHTNDGITTRTFISSITDLGPGITYYVRAYATNCIGTAYGNEISFTTGEPITLAIGQPYQGGIIAYILQPGDPGYKVGQTQGLIAAPSDQNTGIPWYNGSYTTTGATSTIIGAGSVNTNIIVASQGAGNYAASLCYNLVLGGYSDWFLPSKDELNKVYLSKEAIGGLSNYYYWSSSECESGTAWLQDFGYGSQLELVNKVTPYGVRAVRAF